jgi:peptide-methionine (S)-S-oxide reductase
MYQIKRMRFLAPLLAVTLTAAAPPALQTATFAGGCFWTMQHGLDAVPGVVKTVAGYTGGSEPDPTYQQVSSESTGHVEAVRVTFDPAKIGYAELTRRYFRMIDPTDSGGQACDRGPSYRATIFTASSAQRQAALASEAQAAQQLGRKIVVPIRSTSAFWPAEGYHQHYADKNPAAYGAYRIGCGRDRILAKLWGTAR